MNGELQSPAAGELSATPTELLLGKFLDKVLERLQLNETVDVEEMLRDRPDLVERGRQLVAGLVSFGKETPRHAPGAGTPPPSSGAPAARPAAAARPPGSAGGLPDPFPGEFRIRRLLGEGAFGKVWLADDLHLGRPVALKTLRVPADSEAGAATLTALRKEANFLAGLRHNNVVQVHAWRQAGDEHFLVLQYVPGGSLAGLLSKDRPLDWQRAARYVADIGEGLLAVHSGGVVHRDIKPDNMLLDSEHDEALLTDFGISARLADARTVAGTPLYMAPEAFEGRASAASDVYGLAATLFRLLTTDVPFRGNTWSELREQIRRGLPDPDARCRGVPEALERVMRAGLAATPEARPTLRAFVDQLRGALNQALADALAAPATVQPGSAPKGLRLVVSRESASGDWQPVAATHPPAGPLQRDMKKVPRPPERVRLQTGDRVRVDVTADRDGFVTVFNVGPTGNLNLLYPDDPRPPGAPPDVRSGQALRVLDVELEPPAGRERLFAVWSREPMSLSANQLQSYVAEGTGSRPYRATRDMKRVHEAVRQAGPGDSHVVVLELEHATVP